MKNEDGCTIASRVDDLISIENKGQRIVITNYFDTENARSGFVYLSWNAGAGRVLLPDSRKEWLPEMRTAKHVIVSRGPWAEQGGRDGLELLFEDDSDDPFCILLVAEQCDRLLPDTDQGGGFQIAVWTRGGEKIRLPGKYRSVEKIPSLERWTDH